jgi:hypothetical protein
MVTGEEMKHEDSQESLAAI